MCGEGGPSSWATAWATRRSYRICWRLPAPARLPARPPAGSSDEKAPGRVEVAGEVQLGIEVVGAACRHSPTRSASSASAACSARKTSTLDRGADRCHDAGDADLGSMALAAALLLASMVWVGVKGWRTLRAPLPGPEQHLGDVQRAHPAVERQDREHGARELHGRASAAAIGETVDQVSDPRLQR
jgi:hypothetical protein